MGKTNELVEGSWVPKLSAAIVYQAFQDYLQGLICTYDSLCAPANISLTYAEFLVNDAMNFFKSTYCHSLTDLDCVMLAKQIKGHVPEFVERLRKARPKYSEALNEDIDEFECPNCGASVLVRWVNKKSGIIKGNCRGCMFHAIYRLPLSEVAMIGW